MPKSNLSSTAGKIMIPLTLLTTLSAGDIWGKSIFDDLDLTSHNMQLNTDTHQTLYTR